MVVGRLPLVRWLVEEALLFGARRVVIYEGIFGWVCFHNGSVYVDSFFNFFFLMRKLHRGGRMG